MAVRDTFATALETMPSPRSLHLEPRAQSTFRGEWTEGDCQHPLKCSEEQNKHPKIAQQIPGTFVSWCQDQSISHLPFFVVAFFPHISMGRC